MTDAMLVKIVRYVFELAVWAWDILVLDWETVVEKSFAACLFALMLIDLVCVRRERK
jgi:hypothetical protein